MFFRIPLVVIFLVVCSLQGLAQSAILKGTITDNLGSPAAFVNVVEEESKKGVLTNAEGYYEIKLPAEKKVVISVQGLNYKDINFSVKLSTGESFTRNVTIQIKEEAEVIVIGEQTKERKEISTGVIETKDVAVLPNVSGGVETFLVTQLGVQKNNELSSAYSVRGGNFDENLVYVNDFEIYRPFLIRSGQQEGLSFVNPDMTDKLTFSSGGFSS